MTVIRRRIAWTAAIAVLTIAVVTMLLNRGEATAWLCEGYQADQSCIRRFIYDFQGLISGLLAVGAAWWTISAMRHQHEEQIRFATKADSVRVKRFLGVIIPALTDFRKQIARFEESVPQGGYEPEWNRESGISIRYAAYAVTRAKIAISDPVLEECVPMFDAEMTHALRDLRVWVDALLHSIPEDPVILDFLMDPGEPIRPSWYEELVFCGLVDFRASIDNFIEKSRKWSQREGAT